MDARRLATVALCRSVVFASCVIAWPQSLSSSEIESTGAAQILDGRSAAPAGEAAPAETQPVAVAPADGHGAAETAATIAATAPTIGAAVPATPELADRAEPIDKPIPPIQTASANPLETLPLETSSSQVPTAATPDREPNEVTASINAIEVVDECFVVDICVDRYLWALYQRAPKQDTIRVSEQRQVTVKRKGRKVTVTRTFSRPVDEDFAWKDRKASDRAGMPIEDYVIGGMDRSFKLKLFHVLHAAEEAGLSPGITSAFRDDYRQSIASGLKAASNKSYHGGSFRGGYGHGLAADIVSTKGASRAERWASTEVLWKWVDAHGKEFGIGRPYLSYDPPHVGPTDGQEYASRRGGQKTQYVEARAKKRTHLAARHDHRSARRVKIASVKVGRIRSARNAHARAT